MDFYFDSDNKLTVRQFNKTSADYVLNFAADILELQLSVSEPVFTHCKVFGESPASTSGLAIWPWLAKDISPFIGEAGQGDNLLLLRDGAIKTKDGADRLAAAKVMANQNHSCIGKLKILGHPKINLADAIEIKDAPKAEMNGLFKVAGIQHIVNKRDGYVTCIDFSGANSSQSLVGLAGAATGALGL
jgi:hypothetical protein